MWTFATSPNFARSEHEKRQYLNGWTGSLHEEPAVRGQPALASSAPHTDGYVTESVRLGVHKPHTTSNCSVCSPEFSKISQSCSRSSALEDALSNLEDFLRSTNYPVNTARDRRGVESNHIPSFSNDSWSEGQNHSKNHPGEEQRISGQGNKFEYIEDLGQPLSSQSARNSVYSEELRRSLSSQTSLLYSPENELIETAESCRACRELRCPRNCTNWRAHSIGRYCSLSSSTLPGNSASTLPRNSGSRSLSELHQRSVVSPSGWSPQLTTYNGDPAFMVRDERCHSHLPSITERFFDGNTDHNKSQNHVGRKDLERDTHHFYLDSSRGEECRLLQDNYKNCQDTSLTDCVEEIQERIPVSVLIHTWAKRQEPQLGDPHRSLFSRQHSSNQQNIYSFTLGRGASPILECTNFQTSGFPQVKPTVPRAHSLVNLVGGELSVPGLSNLRLETAAEGYHQELRLKAPTMERGYVQAMAKQMNHHKGGASAASGDDDVNSSGAAGGGGSTVSVANMIKKLNTSGGNRASPPHVKKSLSPATPKCKSARSASFSSYSDEMYPLKDLHNRSSPGSSIVKNSKFHALSANSECPRPSNLQRKKSAPAYTLAPRNNMRLHSEGSSEPRAKPTVDYTRKPSVDGGRPSPKSSQQQSFSDPARPTQLKTARSASSPPPVISATAATPPSNSPLSTPQGLPSPTPCVSQSSPLSDSSQEHLDSGDPDYQNVVFTGPDNLPENTPSILLTPAEPCGKLRSSPGRQAAENYCESVLKTIYDNGPPFSASQLMDSSDSDSNKDEVEETIQEPGIASVTHTEPVEAETEESIARTESQKRAESDIKRRHIVEEMLKTEKDYVDKLHLLHQKFHFRLDEENRKYNFVPPETLKEMFSNIGSIYRLHKDFVLTQIEERVKNWDKNPCIGDVMKQNAPFLKMYSEYIANFDQAMKLIDQWTKKSQKFSEIIKKVQELPECGSLSLQHHMLEPIQRVPRYEMLLKDYVKRLPQESPDMKDAKDALDLVTKAATHSNKAMEKIETFHKLLDIYQTLKGVPLDFISPTRQFIEQGAVTKIAARSGEKQPRHLFLFNDLILVCNMFNTLLGTYNIRSQIDMETLEIKPGSNMNIANTFRLHCKQKTVELLDDDQSGSKFGWEEKIRQQLELYKERKRSFKKEDHKFLYEPSMPESWVGKTAPVWVPDDAASMCMLCEQTFTFVRRRHHCRGCGKLICGSCVKNAPLQYMKGKIDKVCKDCYNVIVNKQAGSDLMDKKKGLLQIKASEQALASSYVNCSEDDGVSWHRMWITAHSDFVLYYYKAHEDVSAISCLPLPGHEVKQRWDVEGRPHVFTLMHKKRTVGLYQTTTDQQLKRWIHVIGRLAMADLPDDDMDCSEVQPKQERLSVHSTTSSTASASSEGDSGNHTASNVTISSSDNTSNNMLLASSSIVSNSDNTDSTTAIASSNNNNINTTVDASIENNQPSRKVSSSSTITGQDELGHGQVGGLGAELSADHEDADRVSEYDNVDDGTT